MICVLFVLKAYTQLELWWESCRKCVVLYMYRTDGWILQCVVGGILRRIYYYFEVSFFSFGTIFFLFAFFGSLFFTCSLKYSHRHHHRFIVVVDISHFKFARRLKLCLAKAELHAFRCNCLLLALLYVFAIRNWKKAAREGQSER